MTDLYSPQFDYGDEFNKSSDYANSFWKKIYTHYFDSRCVLPVETKTSVISRSV